MATRTFRTPNVGTLGWWRVDTAAGSDTPAAITRPDGTSLYGVLRSDERGNLSAPSFRGPDGVTVLYLKRLTREIAGTVVAGSTITLDTGTADQVVAPVPGPLTVAEATATFARRSASVEGLTITCYGHSYVAGGNGNFTANAHWRNRLATRLGVTVVNRGVGADNARQTVSNRMLNGTGSTAFTAGTKGIVVIEATINDVRRNGTSVNAVNYWKNTMRAGILLCRADTKTEQGVNTPGTESGTWTTATFADLSGGTSRYSSGTPGDYIDIPVTVGSAGEVTFLTTKSRVGLTGGDWVVKEGATVLASGSAQPGTDGIPSVGFNYSHYPIRLTGQAPGAHTYRFEATSSILVHMDGWLVGSATPPTVVLGIDPDLTTAAYAANSPYNTGTPEIRAAYLAAANELAAEFPTNEVVVCDLNRYWDATTCLTSDSVHPNDIGYAAIADAYKATILSLPPRSGMQVLA